MDEISPEGEGHRQESARRGLEKAERVRRDRQERERPEAERSAARAQRERQGAAAESALSAMAEQRMREAIDRGEFENLPGAGKPLPGVDGRRDLDWWMRRRTADTPLPGGPPALTLRREDAEMEATLDALSREAAVRAALESFNRRVVEARRQLQGGPPVITETRDVEEEVRAWRERRDRRRAEEEALEAALPVDDARRGRILRYLRWRKGR